MVAKKEKYPVLPLRDIVVYPKMIVPLFVGREKSINALQEVVDKDQNIILTTQKDAAIEDPTSNDVYHVGTIGTVLQLLRLPDGTVKVLIEGLERVKIDKFYNTKSFMEANITILPEIENNNQELEALVRAVLSQFEEYVKLSKKTPPEVLVAVNQIEDYSKLADTIASHLALKIPEKQALLEGTTLSERFEQILGFMDAEITMLEVENRIKNRVKKQMEKSQKEYYLNEQMKAIQKELGDGDDDAEIAEYMKKIENTKLSKEAKEKALAEVKKLKSMSSMSAEATVVRNYLDWMLDIPWKKRSKVNKDLSKAMEILEEDHYGLEEVKERIVEYLAVQSRADKVKGPILCLVGPPGVGKTSLGKSIARATGRSFVRASLGGMRDEAEIRGHRRTYIGSMPGKIIKGMKKAATSNPLFLLDEIDKKVGLANTVVFLTSTGYFKGEAKESPIYNIPSGEFYPRRAVSLLNVYLMALYGQGDWVIGYQNRQIFLNRKLIKERDVDADEMRNRAASFLIQMTGVQDVYTSQRLLLSNGTDRVAAMRNSYYPKLSGDLVLDLCPGWEVVYEDANDTREYVRVNAVPAPCFILAHDVKPVRITSPVRATAIAPTVSRLLRIRSPNGSADAPLPEIQY